MNLHVPLAAGDVDANVVAVPEELEIDGGAGNLQVADMQFLQEGRKLRIVEGDERPAGVDREAETGLEHHEDGSRCPGLRRAGDGIECGPFSGAPHEAAE